MINKRVLVVDDDVSIRAIISISLETITNWQILTASSGKEAIAMAAAELPDAILLDWMMPDMDGVETLRNIRANSITQSIPVIFLTAKTMIQEESPLDDLMFSGIITKPFKAPNLVKEMRSLLHWED